MWSADRDEMVVALREQVIDAERRVAELLHERDMLRAALDQAQSHASEYAGRLAERLAHAESAGH